MTKIVRFTKPFGVYATGDVAGLSDEEAKAAIEAEAAVLYKSEKGNLQDEKSVDQAGENKMINMAPKKKEIK